MRSGSDPDVDPKYYHYIVPFLRPQGVWQLFDCCPPVRETKKFIKYLRARNWNWRFRPYSFGLEYQGQLSPSRQAPSPPSRQLYGALYEVTSCDTFPATSLSAELKHAGSKHSFSLLVLGRWAKEFIWKKGVLPYRVILSAEAIQLILTSCITQFVSQTPPLSPSLSQDEFAISCKRLVEFFQRNKWKLSSARVTRGRSVARTAGGMFFCTNALFFPPRFLHFLPWCGSVLTRSSAKWWPFSHLFQ